MPPEVKEALQALTPRAVQVLAELLESDDDRVRVAAVNTVLDRSLGKPVAALEVSGPDGAPLAARNTRFDWSKLSATEFAAVRDALMRASVSTDAPSKIIDVTPTAPTDSNATSQQIVTNADHDTTT